MSVSVQVWTGLASTVDEFSDARDARRFVLNLAKAMGARWEGNGREGSLIVGQGSAKRTVAIYEIV